jgi:hypothetical protein
VRFVTVSDNAVTTGLEQAQGSRPTRPGETRFCSSAGLVRHVMQARTQESGQEGSTILSTGQRK